MAVGRRSSFDLKGPITGTLNVFFYTPSSNLLNNFKYNMCGCVYVHVCWVFDFYACHFLLDSF